MKKSKPAKKAMPSQHPSRIEGKVGRVARSTRKPASTQGERVAGVGGLAKYYASRRELPEYKSKRAEIRIASKKIAAELAAKLPVLPVKKKVTSPIMPAKREPGPTRTDFDPDFYPIDGPTRRARLAMLETLFFDIGGKNLRRPADPYEAQELRRQEDRGRAEIEAVRALRGKNADWRTVLCFEARTSLFSKADAVNEIAWHLSRAATRGDAGVLHAFARAVEMVNKWVKRGPDNCAKIAATLYCIHHENSKGTMPKRDDVKKFLESKNLLPASLDEKHGCKLDCKFFIAPYLSLCPVNRPWGRLG